MSISLNDFIKQSYNTKFTQLNILLHAVHNKKISEADFLKYCNAFWDEFYSDPDKIDALFGLFSNDWLTFIRLNKFYHAEQVYGWIL